MLVTELGIEADVRAVQPEKALSPMLVTEEGIVTDIREVQSLKALAPTVVYAADMTASARHEAQSWQSSLFDTAEYTEGTVSVV